MKVDQLNLLQIKCKRQRFNIWSWPLFEKHVTSAWALDTMREIFPPDYYVVWSCYLNQITALDILTTNKKKKSNLIWLAKQVGIAEFQEAYQENISWHRPQDSKRTALHVCWSSKLTVATFHTVSMDTGEILLRSHNSLLPSSLIIQKYSQLQ